MRLLLKKISISISLFLFSFSSLSGVSQDDFPFSIEDSTYVENFSFDSYKVAHIQSQGSFYIDTMRDTIKGTLSRGDPWEPHIAKLIEEYTRNGSIAVDCGSHIGTHSLTMSRAVGNDGLVFCFEPQIKIFSELYHNIQLNDRHNIIALHFALSDTEGTDFLGPVPPENEGGRKIDSSGQEPVVLTTLDSFGLHDVSFIKIDVEGHENNLLVGAKETILRCKPIIIIELWNRPERGISIEYLKELGYTVRHISGDDFLAIPEKF